MAMLNNQMVYVDFFIYFFISGVKSVSLCTHISKSNARNMYCIYRILQTWLNRIHKQDVQDTL